MKFNVIELSGEEKVIYCKTPKNITLGEFFSKHIDDVKAIQINGQFVENWQAHTLDEKDTITVFPKINDPVSIIVSLLISLALSVLSALLAPKPKKPSSSKSQPSIGVAGIQNTVAPGTPKFFSYGTRKIYGHLIASTIGLSTLDEDKIKIYGKSPARSDTSRRMTFSTLYYMGIGEISAISDIKINETHLCDIYGPPKANLRFGTDDQTIITGHELAHQTYYDGREIEITLRRSKRLYYLPGRPITYTTKGRNVDRVTFFFNFPGGLWTLGMKGSTYPNFVGLQILRKKNTESAAEWVNLGIFNSIKTTSRTGFFWKIQLDLPESSQWDFQINMQKQYGGGSWQSGPSMTLFNCMETKFITTSYPGNALLEINGIASDQIQSLDSMAASAVVDGRLIDVYQNGFYIKQFTRNRVWIVRDILFNKTIALGNRLDESIWDNNSGLQAAKYYEEYVPDFDGNDEQRDYCDVVINEARPGWDHIKNLLFEGRASLIPSSGKLKYILDKNYEPELSYSFPGNIIQDTLQLERGSGEKPLNTLRAEFPSIASDYQVIPTKLISETRGDDPERSDSISFTSIVRESQVARLMRFRLDYLTKIKRRWVWKSSQTGISSEPLDIAWLSYNVNKYLRGYSGYIQGENSTNNTIYLDKNVYLSAGITYSLHLRHNNTVEEKFVTNTLGNTYSIVSLNSSLSFTPENGDIWVIGEANEQIRRIQIDDIEFDGETFSIRAHEHIPEIYDDVLQSVTDYENATINDGGTPPQLLKAQATQAILSGITYTTFNVVPAFSYLKGNYTVIGTNSIILETKEPPVDDWFIGAYIQADIERPLEIIDYVGNTRQVIVHSPGFAAAATVGGEYLINWPVSSEFYGTSIDSSPTYNGNYFYFANGVGTSVTTTRTRQAQVGGTYLTIDRITYTSGMQINCHVHDGPGNPTDWVGLFAAAAGNTQYSSYKYLNNSTIAPVDGLTEADITFTAPVTSGNYQLRFFINDSILERDKLDSINFSVGSTATALAVPSYFRYGPYSIKGNVNTIGRWRTSIGVTETIAPKAPFTSIITGFANDSDNKSAIVDITLDAPLDRDIKAFETILYLNSINGTALTNSIITDVYNSRDETDTDLVISAANFDVTDIPNESTLFARTATLDFFGNKSDYNITFTGITLSAVSILDDRFTLDISGSTTSYTGSTISTLFSTIINANEIDTDNNVEMDIKLSVFPGSVTSTYLEFKYVFAGVTVNTVTSSIADGASQIPAGTPLWLHWIIEYLDTVEQLTTTEKFGREPSGYVVTTATTNSNLILDLDQTMSIYMTIVGDTSTRVTMERATSNQITRTVD